MSAQERPTTHRRKAETDSSEERERPSYFQIRLDGVSVLVIEDVPDARLLVARLLARAGASVFTSASAREAREILSQAQVDVIVSDIAMPEEDGLAFIRWLRHVESLRGGHIPAIALTAFNDPQVRMHSLRAGFQAHICKTSSSSLLLKTVFELINVDDSTLH
jgi:CheY-like chemotaxis protein